MRAFNDACVPVAYVTSYKNWPTTDVKVGKQTEKRSLHFPRLTVEELQQIRKTAPDALTKLGSFSTPAYLIFDPSKEKLGDRMDRASVTSAAMLDDLKVAQKKLGAGAPLALYRDFARALAAVSGPLEGDELAKAVKALPSLDKLKGLTSPMKKEADAVRDTITAKGEEKIKDAESYADVDPSAAKEALQKLLEIFKGHPLEKKIREKLKS